MTTAPEKMADLSEEMAAQAEDSAIEEASPRKRRASRRRRRRANPNGSGATPEDAIRAAVTGAKPPPDPLHDARQRVKKLLKRAAKDPGAAVEDQAAKDLALLQRDDAPAYERAFAELRRCKAPLRGITSAVKRARSQLPSKKIRSNDKEHAGNFYPYSILNNMLHVRKTSQYGEYDAPLTTFVAQIDTESIHDDGAERTHFFAISGTLQDGRVLPTVEIAADKFMGMGWVAGAWGNRAIIRAGQGTRDHARTAIQLFSGDVPRRVTYTHTGWREINGEWIYLHAGGGIGSRGLVTDVETSLQELEVYKLPAPPEGEALIAAIEASLHILDLGKQAITVPAFAAIWRSVFGAADLSLHFVGKTGAFKTELATLMQQHFGSGFDSRNLPGSWESTGNNLEARAFQTKDALFTIDDFAPAGTQHDIARMHRDAARVFRAQGNRSGRGRLRPDGTPRPVKPPRGLVLSTGEDLPVGQSIRARVLIVEFALEDIDTAKLTIAQKAAAAGRYAEAMAGFIRWLAGQLEAEQKLPRYTAERDRLTELATGDHRRTPRALAVLGAALRLFLDFAVEVGALTATEADERWQRCWQALRNVGQRQAQHQASEDPVNRFLTLIGAALAAQKVHLGCARDPDEPPTNAGSLGWTFRKIGTGAYQRDEWQPNGDRVGWIDGESVYLNPDAAFAAAQRLAGNQGQSLALNQRTLWKQLDEAGKLVSREKSRQRFKVRVMIGRQRIPVIHISLNSLYASGTGPTGPTGPQPNDDNGLADETVGQSEGTAGKPAHGTGPAEHAQMPAGSEDGPDMGRFSRRWAGPPSRVSPKSDQKTSPNQSRGPKGTVGPEISANTPSGNPDELAGDNDTQRETGEL